MDKTHLELPQHKTIPQKDTGDSSLRSILQFIGTFLIAGVLLFLFWYLSQVFLLVFAGVLLAILFHLPADGIQKYTPLGKNWSIVVVLLLVIGLLVLAWRFFAPDILTQMGQLSAVLPDTLMQARQSLERYAWINQVLDHIPPIQQMLPSPTNILSRISTLFSGIMGLVTGTFVVLFTGLYLTFQPEMYINGIVRLFPQQRHRRVREVLHHIGHALRWWLIGRLFSMVVLGTITGVALWWLDVPFALALGIVTGLLSFVPIIGSILAVIPASLVALSQSPTMLLYVLLVYWGAQTIESYLLTPAVQERAVSMPPVLAFVIQLILGVLVGILGVALAYPVAIVGLVLVRMIYIEDILGE